MSSSYKQMGPMRKAPNSPSLAQLPPSRNPPSLALPPQPMPPISILHHFDESTSYKSTRRSKPPLVPPWGLPESCSCSFGACGRELPDLVLLIIKKFFDCLLSIEKIKLPFQQSGRRSRIGEFSNELQPLPFQLQQLCE